MVNLTPRRLQFRRNDCNYRELLANLKRKEPQQTFENDSFGDEVDRQPGREQPKTDEKESELRLLDQEQSQS